MEPKNIPLFLGEKTDINDLKEIFAHYILRDGSEKRKEKYRNINLVDDNIREMDELYAQSDYFQESEYNEPLLQNTLMEIFKSLENEKLSVLVKEYLDEEDNIYLLFQKKRITKEKYNQEINNIKQRYSTNARGLQNALDKFKQENSYRPLISKSMTLGNLTSSVISREVGSRGIEETAIIPDMIDYSDFKIIDSSEKSITIELSEEQITEKLNQKYRDIDFKPISRKKDTEYKVGDITKIPTNKKKTVPTFLRNANKQVAETLKDIMDKKINSNFMIGRTEIEVSQDSPNTVKILAEQTSELDWRNLKERREEIKPYDFGLDIYLRRVRSRRDRLKDSIQRLGQGD